MGAFEEQRRRPEAAGVRWCGDVRAVLEDDPFDERTAGSEPKTVSVPDAAA